MYLLRHSAVASFGVVKDRETQESQNTTCRIYSAAQGGSYLLLYLIPLSHGDARLFAVPPSAGSKLFLFPLCGKDKIISFVFSLQNKQVLGFKNKD